MEKEVVRRHISEILLGTAFMQYIGRRFPGLYGWVGKRLDHHSFFGLPFTLLVPIFIGNIMLLTEIAEGVVNSKIIVTFDLAIAKAASVLQKPLIIQFFLLYTMLGSPYIIIPFVTVLALYFFLKKKRTYAIGLLISSIGAGLTSVIGKSVFHRARPVLQVYYMPHSYSFPSGHSAIAAAVYGILLYIFWMDAKAGATKNIIVTAGIILILLLAFSRIFLGVHFFSDVSAGLLMGGLWLLLGVSLMEYFKTKSRRVETTSF